MWNVQSQRTACERRVPTEHLEPRAKVGRADNRDCKASKVRDGVAQEKEHCDDWRNARNGLEQDHELQYGWTVGVSVVPIHSAVFRVRV